MTMNNQTRPLPRIEKPRKPRKNRTKGLTTLTNSAEERTGLLLLEVLGSKPTGPGAATGAPTGEAFVEFDSTCTWSFIPPRQ